MSEHEDVTGGLDRRSLLKKGAIGGAIAWTAPTILSSPAFAGTVSPGCSAPATLFANNVAGQGPIFSIPTASVRSCLLCPEGDLTVEGGEGVASTFGVGEEQVVGILAQGATGFRVRFRGCNQCVDIVYSVSGLTATQVGSDTC